MERCSQYSIYTLNKKPFHKRIPFHNGVIFLNHVQCNADKDSQQSKVCFRYPLTIRNEKWSFSYFYWHSLLEIFASAYLNKLVVYSGRISAVSNLITPKFNHFPLMSKLISCTRCTSGAFHTSTYVPREKS